MPCKIAVMEYLNDFFEFDAALKAIIVGRVIRDDLKCKKLLESIL